MKNKTTKSAKKLVTKKATKAAPAPVEAPAPAPKEANKKPASWLIGRLRNALHKSDPSLKKDQTLKGVSTLSDIRAALQKDTEEWEALLETFFNLGGKLEE